MRGKDVFSDKHNICRQLLVQEFEKKLHPQKTAPSSKMTATPATPNVTRHRIKSSKEKQLHALHEEESTTKVHRRVHDALTDELANRTLQLKRQNLAIQELVRKDAKVSKRLDYYLIMTLVT